MAWLAFDSMMCPFNGGFEYFGEAQVWDSKEDAKDDIDTWFYDQDDTEEQVVKLYEVTEKNARLEGSYRLTKTIKWNVEED